MATELTSSIFVCILDQNKCPRESHYRAPTLQHYHNCHYHSSLTGKTCSRWRYCIRFLILFGFLTNTTTVRQRNEHCGFDQVVPSSKIDSISNSAGTISAIEANFKRPSNCFVEKLITNSPPLHPLEFRRFHSDGEKY